MIKQLFQSKQKEIRRCLKVKFGGQANSGVYDVIVIGGGHAGCEAAHIATVMGCKTALLTQSKSTIGEMSCNPSFGGIGKTTLIREIDALGGIMPRLIDRNFIHFRNLNSSKGAAVHGLRVQVDRDKYQKDMVRHLLGLKDYAKGLTIIEAKVASIKVDPSTDTFQGVMLEGDCFVRGKTCVLTTGTFLRGRIRIGDKTIEGGRSYRDGSGWEPPSNDIGQLFRDYGVKTLRLRTGTPPRLNKHTIDYSKLEFQDTKDEVYIPMHLPNRVYFPNFKKFNSNQQIDCYLTRTTQKTKDIVMENLDLLPDYKTELDTRIPTEIEESDAFYEKSKPPRYCPSIDAKIYRFQDKEYHQIWLEPESADPNIPTLFPNGLSTGFPLEIQQKIIASVLGLEKAEILRPAYSVEYDCVNPQELGGFQGQKQQALLHEFGGLEMGKIQNLWLAGQINGTTGYEEAGVQGIIAGVNASLRAKNDSKLSSLMLARDEAMLQVLIDDITSLGLTEPYRIFTSRSEYRLTTRPDNSYERLSRQYTSKFVTSELQGMEEMKSFFTELEERTKQLKNLSELFRSTQVKKKDLEELELDSQFSVNDNSPKTIECLVKNFNFGVPEVSKIIKFLRSKSGTETCDLSAYNPSYVQDLVIDIKYSQYSEKAKKEAEQILAHSQNLNLVDFDYSQLKGIITGEELEILMARKPQTLEAVSRISGIRPNTLLIIRGMVLNPKTKAKSSISKKMI